MLSSDNLFSFNALLLDALLLVTAVAFYRLKLHPLSKFPGPKLWALSHVPYAYYYVRGTLHYRLAELFEDYGHVVRIAPGELAFIHEDAWSDIYFSYNGRQFSRDPTTAAAAPEGGTTNMVTTLNEDDHARMKRVLAPSFSETTLRKQEQYISSYVDLLIQRLHENAGEAIDIWQWVKYAIFDIIGDLTFGESFDCLVSSREHEWVTTMFSFTKAATFVSAATKLYPLHKLLILMVPQSLLEKDRQHRAQTNAKLERRLANKDARPDFLSVAIATLDSPHGMSTIELRENAAAIIFAGSETSATSLAGTIYYLLMNPTKMQTLVTHVRAAFASEQDITMQHVRERLPYQLAVINESLRLYPPAPIAFSLNRVVPHEGASIAGNFVPGRTVVAVAPWAAFRSSRNFADPTAFVPERWLKGDECPERYRDDKRKVVQPFGAGPRGCIGKALAYAEMGLILARILWSFDLELCEEGKAWGPEKTNKVFLIWKHEPLMVRFTPVKG